jgi:hypothetical protein
MLTYVATMITLLRKPYQTSLPDNKITLACCVKPYTAILTKPDQIGKYLADPAYELFTRIRIHQS